MDHHIWTLHAEYNNQARTNFPDTKSGGIIIGGISSPCSFLFGDMPPLREWIGIPS